MPLSRADAIFRSDRCRKRYRRGQAAERGVELWCEDARRSLPGCVHSESVDLIVTNFPYTNEPTDNGFTPPR